MIALARYWQASPDPHNPNIGNGCSELRKKKRPQKVFTSHYRHAVIAPKYYLRLEIEQHEKDKENKNAVWKRKRIGSKKKKGIIFHAPRLATRLGDAEPLASTLLEEEETRGICVIIHSCLSKE